MRRSPRAQRVIYLPPPPPRRRASELEALGVAVVIAVLCAVFFLLGRAL